MLENKGVLNLIALSMLGSMMEGNIKELKKKEKILGKYTGQDWIDDLLDIAPSRNNVPKNKPQKRQIYRLFW